MNILFFTEEEVHPNIGGIERVTSILANAFIVNYKANVYSMFLRPILNSPDIFSEHKQWDGTVDDICSFINNNKIDVFICQRQIESISLLAQAIERSDHICLFVNVLHCTPGYELTEWRYLLYRMFHGDKLSRCKSLAKLLSYPFYRSYSKLKVRKIMHCNYSYSDTFILLSQSYKELYSEVYNIKNKQKCISINNPLSYSEYYSDEEYSKKEHILIIVCRLEERSKRVSLLLKIWKKIQKKKGDWKLYIIGDGPNRKDYETMIYTQRIQDVSMLGFVDPFSYYKKASLFALTSANEGWPMALTEAMQCGVVPVVMDSFLSVHDIIKHGENGLLVRDRDINAFATSLLHLINNQKERVELAKNAVQAMKRFSPDVIAGQWMKLFTDLFEQKKMSDV